MRILAVIFGVFLIIAILQDSFEAIILPRKVSRRFRLSRLFYAATWAIWSFIGRKLRAGNRREFYLSYYGPLSVILLLILWAAVLMFAYALLQWGLSLPMSAPEKNVTFGTYLYLSGTTFITLGLGDVIPLAGVGRFLAVAEAGMGFGFLALIIGYVPIIYQAFSRREINISLLDARAGSPPSATEMLRRHYRTERIEEVIQKSWRKSRISSSITARKRLSPIHTRIHPLRKANITPSMEVGDRDIQWLRTYTFLLVRVSIDSCGRGSMLLTRLPAPVSASGSRPVVLSWRGGVRNGTEYRDPHRVRFLSPGASAAANSYPNWKVPRLW